MFLALLILLLILASGAVGFAVHILWVVAVVLFLLWIVGFLARGAERSWYRW